MPDLINAAILGARGYVGVELIQLLDSHPHVNLKAVFSLPRARLLLQFGGSTCQQL